MKQEVCKPHILKRERAFGKSEFFIVWRLRSASDTQKQELI